MEMQELSRQRIDFEEGPNGETIAHLTVTLQDGSVHRYTESVTAAELDGIGRAYARAEAPPGTPVEGLFGDIAKGLGGAVKGVANVAKKVVTSKVFQTAGKGLAIAAPALGPFAPAAMAVAGGMAVASKLGSAAVAAEAGAKKVAKALTSSAQKDAQKFAKNDPRQARKLLEHGNQKRKAAAAVAERARPKQAKGKGKAKGKGPNLLAAARAGKIRSNRPGRVKLGDLMSAHRTGRVFWIAA